MSAPVFDRPATLERRTTDWVRHEGNGSPKILPPPGVEWRSPSGKTKQAGRYYTRVTTFAKAIDETSKLMAWKMRGVLVGAAQRPDYAMAAAALTLSAEDRKAGDELAEKCLQAAKGDGAALVGTALHTWTERLDRGEPLGYVPPELAPLLDAYVRLTAPLTFLHREVRMVCDDLETAGTPDAIGTCSIPDPDGVVDGLRIIDLKSGKVSYPGPMSVQLATYGRSALYDPATGERTPLEGVNQRWGLIVHTQQDGEVPPGLYWLNLQHGNEGIELCRQVRGWRKVKPAAILQAVDGLGPDDAAAQLDPPAEEPQEPMEEPQDAARRAILGAVTTADLGVLWDQQGAEWPAELVDLAGARYQELREQEELAKPRAALASALRVATGEELRELWAKYAGTPLWTTEHAAVAETRYRELGDA